jgi:SAM-dependent methyltransferase
MKENKYDDPSFFEAYANTMRSRIGLERAGEWPTLKQLLPDLQSKRVLDLGCGYGWHCRYAAEKGAASVLGVDLSTKMLEKAQTMTSNPRIQYQKVAIEEFEFPPASFDVVLSSLAMHYIADFTDLCRKVYETLSSQGIFVFSVEHPIFTAYGNQDWMYDAEGNKDHWPVDHYFQEGKRTSIFLKHEVIKYHRTLDTYLNGLLRNGFRLSGFAEPVPDAKMISQDPSWKDELRRPMMLIMSATKEENA